MRILRAALLAATALLAVPAEAAPVVLNFQGVSPFFGGSIQGAGSGPFTTFQNNFLAQLNTGNTYNFTVSYDTTATPSGGLYPLTLFSGQLGGLTDFSDFTPYIQFQQAGAYTYMNLMLRKTEAFGTTYVAFALGDNDGTVVANVLPATVVGGDYDFVSASFEIYGPNSSRRSLVDGNSRVTQVFLQSGVPEPATWAMLIAGFGMIGGAVRRRSVKVAYA